MMTVKPIVCDSGSSSCNKASLISHSDIYRLPEIIGDGYVIAARF